MVRLLFEDGTTMQGKLIASALVVLILKVDNAYYLINKMCLKKDGIVRI